MTHKLSVGPDLDIPEVMLLQYFSQGLNPESIKFLDASSGGSFAHLTPSEGRKILDLILEHTSYTRVYDELPDEPSTSPKEEESQSILVHHMDSPSLPITAISTPKPQKEFESESIPIPFDSSP